MKSFLFAAGCALAFAVPASAAFADDDARFSFAVTQAQAEEIALANGMQRIDEIERDAPKWELDGCTADGREIEIDIHGRTGEIIKIDIDKDDFC